MLKARSKADTGRRFRLVTDQAAETLYHLDMVGAAIYIGQQRGVIAGADPCKMRLEGRREASCLWLQHGFAARVCEKLDSIALEEGTFLRKHSGLFIRVGKIPSLDLRGLHIR